MNRLSLLCVFGLIGCTHVDTGQIDYRVARNEPANSQPTGCDRPENRCVSLVNRYLPANDDITPFAPGEIYSIEIEQVVIGNNILEGHFFGRNLDRSGEFAILANVFEFAGDPSLAAQRRFLNSGELERSTEDPSDVELKLVYYGDDIQARQPLNFSNIPLQQRSSYAGGSIGIQLVVLEVDTRSGPMASLLTTLARFGQQAIPVSSEVSDVLFDLGESLFAGGSGDDRLFEYRFVLSRQTEASDAAQAVFTPGRYVLRRTSHRDSAQQWQDVSLDLNTGRLMQGGSELRDELYMVLNIRRYPEGTLPEHYQLQDWSSVRAAIVAADPLTTPLATLTGQVQTALTEQRSNQWQAQLVERWNAAELSLRSLTNRHRKDLDPAALANCSADVERLRRTSDLAERRALDALRSFISHYRLVTSRPAAADGSPEFRDDEHEALVSRVARYFMPWEGGLETNFADRTAFKTFVDDAASGLTAKAISTARGRARSVVSCDDIRGTPAK